MLQMQEIKANECMKENLEKMNKKFDKMEERIVEKVNVKTGEHENKLLDLESKQIQLQRKTSENNDKLEDSKSISRFKL